jgi:hypothetical protein
MKNLSIIFLFLSSTIIVSAQTLQNDVVASGGGEGSSANMSIEFSIGEPVIETVGTVDMTLTQGFLQPSLTITFIEEDDMLEGISIFPNPVTDELTVDVPLQYSVLKWELLDMNGRVLSSSVFMPGTQTLNMQAYAQGTYVLMIIDPVSGQQLNSKILKTR